MKALKRVETMLRAIAACKKRARKEAKAGNFLEYKTAMEEVLALECLLVCEAQQLVDLLRKAA